MKHDTGDDYAPTPSELAAFAAARSMHGDKAALLNIARRAVFDRGEALYDGRESDAAAAHARYEGVILTLNGGTFFGCLKPGSPGEEVAEYCRAPDGDIPTWLQRGRFVVEVEGMRCLVETKEWEGLASEHMALNALDLERPFFSSTGFYSAFPTVHTGLSVDDVAHALVRAQAKAGLCMVERNACADPCSRWPWVAPVKSKRPAIRVETDGQLAFAV